MYMYQYEKSCFDKEYIRTLKLGDITQATAIRTLPFYQNERLLYDFEIRGRFREFLEDKIADIQGNCAGIADVISTIKTQFTEPDDKTPDTANQVIYMYMVTAPFGSHKYEIIEKQIPYKTVATKLVILQTRIYGRKTIKKTEMYQPDSFHFFSFRRNSELLREGLVNRMYTQYRRESSMVPTYSDLLNRVDDINIIFGPN